MKYQQFKQIFQKYIDQSTPTNSFKIDPNVAADIIKTIKINNHSNHLKLIDFESIWGSLFFKLTPILMLIAIGLSSYLLHINKPQQITQNYWNEYYQHLINEDSLYDN